MARIRTIKPEFFSSEQMSSVSAHARLLAIGLLTLADKEGRLRWIPMQGHAQVFPWETSVNIQVLLGELTGIGYVQQYEVDGKQYLQIANFKKHQRITGKEATYDSKVPAPPVSPNENKGLQSETTVKQPDVSPGASQGSTQVPKEEGRRKKEEGTRSTHTLSHKSESQIRIPQELNTAWGRWELFMLERHGVKVGAIEAEAILKALLDRGPPKAIRDIEFSILKGARSILDSDNDFQKRTNLNKPGDQQKPKTTKAEGARF